MQKKNQSYEIFASICGLHAEICPSKNHHSLGTNFNSEVEIKLNPRDLACSTSEMDANQDEHKHMWREENRSIILPLYFFFHTTSSQLGGTESKVEEILALTGSLGSRRSTVLIFQKLSMSQGGIKLSAARGNYCRSRAQAKPLF
jgi:hypothetical protein